MVVWALGRPLSEIFLFHFFSFFDRASRAFCQHLTCYICKDNEIVVIAQVLQHDNLKIIVVPTILSHNSIGFYYFFPIFFPTCSY